jgi:hypothetical protein
MILPLEIARTLHSNEIARLLCHRRCPAAKTCIGLEAHLLKELQLLEEVGNGLKLTHLGAEAANEHLTSIGVTSVPKLVGLTDEALDP